MLNENAKKWVAALRSGEYTKNVGSLRFRDKFCCLGVACDVAIKDGVKVKEKPESFSNGLFRYNGHLATLPEVVKKWLGLNSTIGQYTKDHALATKNDEGATFEQIADIIESEPEGLFKDTE